MTTQRKITKPGKADNEWACVTCTPDGDRVEFFELESEAEEACRANLHPTTSAYVMRVIKQGEHAVRGTSDHHAVLVEVDDELRRALAFYHRASGAGRPARTMVGAWLKGIMHRHLHVIRSDYRPVARMLKLAQPAVDAAHAAIELGLSGIDPDRTP